MKITTIFDIETGPVEEAELLRMMPVFEPDSRLKDPVKIHDDLRKQREKWMERAALSPISGQVLAIGLLVDYNDGNSITEREIILAQGPCDVPGNPVTTEADILAEFWRLWAEDKDLRSGIWAGFNSNGFDLPFLVRRSWKNNVQVPSDIRSGRYWHNRFLDIRDLWACGEYKADGSLGDIAQFLGVGAKTGSGADFAMLFKVNREEAIAYLSNDLKITRNVYRRLAGRSA